MNIVWFKRDLRLLDNQAIFEALLTNEKTLFLYFFEPKLLFDYHYSQRHFDFVKQSLSEINQQLSTFNTEILIVEEEVIPTLEKIANVFEIDITDLIKNPSSDENINLSILEKVKLIDTLDNDEKACLLKMIDITIAKKKMKDNLTSMMAE